MDLIKRCLIMAALIGLFTISGCGEGGDPTATYPEVDREDKIPGDITKCGPGTDQYPPILSILYSADYNQPIPLPYPVNTAGAEDSPFILPDGNTLYFFFTPDVRVPPEHQVLDDVSGVWVTHKLGDTWSEPERVWLQAPGKLALDGAVCIQDNEMWFASAREGYTGVNMFTAEWIGEAWVNWQYVGDRLMKEIQIGEVHLHGDDLFFHSDREEGDGGFDLWVTTRAGYTWSDPINIEAVNTSQMDGYPFISSDGNELWFTRTYNGSPGIFRSLKVDGNWSEPQLIVSQFAGEPTLDEGGNLYFVHHFYEDDMMIEADIYVAYRRLQG